MSVDPQLFIQSVVEAQLSAARDKQHQGPGPLLALSRDYGAGGMEVAKRLSERLAVGLYDKYLLDAVAKSAKVDPELMAELDERMRSYRDAWIHSLLTGQSVFKTAYRHHLVNVLLGLTKTGGVIVGRGAHVVLANRQIFRLRLIGSEERCAERVSETEGLSYDEALKKVREVNHQRAKFVWDMFKRRLSEPASFDLVVNTDHLHDWDKVSDLVVHAMECAGFPLPEQARKKA